MNEQKLIEYIGKELENLKKQMNKWHNKDIEQYHFTLGCSSALEELLIALVRGDFK